MYDDACHLKKFSMNEQRRDLTDVSKKMSKMEIVCDRFHFRNHVDPWCKKWCDPDACAQLQKVNYGSQIIVITTVQTIVWLVQPFYHPFHWLVMKPFNHQPSPHALSLIGNPNYAKLNYAKVWQRGKICVAKQYIRTIFCCNDHLTNLPPLHCRRLSKLYHAYIYTMQLLKTYT